MLLIYRKTDGVIVGENPRYGMAETLAGQYGSSFRIAVVPHAENKAWLETTVQAKVKERVWQDPKGARQIGGPQPGPDWTMLQDEAFADQTVRAGELSVNPTTGAVLLDGAPASVVMTAAAVDAETAAAIRSRHSLHEELKIARLARMVPPDPAVAAFDAFVESEITKGQTRKAALP